MMHILVNTKVKPCPNQLRAPPPKPPQNFTSDTIYAYHATKPLLTFLTEVQLLLKLVISKLKLGQMARVLSNAITAHWECRLNN